MDFVELKDAFFRPIVVFMLFTAFTVAMSHMCILVTVQFVNMILELSDRLKLYRRLP